jgi:tartrate-resistant acid phosphatase type 5
MKYFFNDMVSRNWFGRFILIACTMAVHCRSLGPLQEDGFRGRPIKGLSSLPESINFIAFGDWGRNGEYYQKAVAKQMSLAAHDIDADFFIVTGDNFYPNGVQSIYDEQWLHSYSNIYHSHSLQADWYVALGNHDYRGRPEAQLEYSQISRRWQMPNRYYTKVMELDSLGKILLLVLDTSPFIKKYYQEDSYRHEVSTQDTSVQKEWLINQLREAAPDIKWKIVVGHHPAYTGGGRIMDASTQDILNSFKPVFEEYGVDFYISGHEHSIQYIKPTGPTHYIVSGAGSEATPSIVYPQIGKFAKGTGGFVSFSLTANQALLHFIDYKGQVLYKTSILK